MTSRVFQDLGKAFLFWSPYQHSEILVRTLWHEASDILICASCMLLLDRAFLCKYSVDK